MNLCRRVLKVNNIENDWLVEALYALPQMLFTLILRLGFTLTILVMRAGRFVPSNVRVRLAIS